MTTSPQRTVDAGAPCPRCGSLLKLVERGVMAAESAEPVRWLPVRKFCPSGCLLTVADFPDG